MIQNVDQRQSCTFLNDFTKLCRNFKNEFPGVRRSFSNEIESSNCAVREVVVQRSTLPHGDSFSG
jgi:hypothetical protein